MKITLLLLIVVILESCSSHEKRNKFTDHQMRIAVFYNRKMSHDQHVRLQAALVKSDVWTIVARDRALEVVKQEQDRLHKGKSSGRYLDSEKFAWYSRMYGVAGLVIGNVKCSFKKSVWRSVVYKRCYQSVNLVSATTGQIIVGVDGYASSSSMDDIPSWIETVEKLIQAYPKYFRPDKTSKRLKIFKQKTKTHAQEQKKRKNQ